MDIAILHPIICYGGAEKLVLSLAQSLKQHHNVHIFTNQYNDSFQQFKYFHIQERGTFFGLIPNRIFNRLHAFFTYLRMLLAGLSVLLFGFYYDLYIVDQVSIVIPLLKLFNRKCIYYCHFPDKCLANEKKGIYYLYRIVIDFIEEISLLFADRILVNSLYTKKMFQENFFILRKLGVTVQVLYPPVDLPQVDASEENFILTFNRIQKKKQIQLAIQSFKNILQQFPDLKLKIGGGYNQNNANHKQYLFILQQLINKYNLIDKVQILLNVTDQQKNRLFSKAMCVVYTPSQEHFGIVPCEAMAMMKPVVGRKSGGLVQTVVQNETGYLINNQNELSQKLSLILNSKQERMRLGKNGRRRIQQYFCFNIFKERIKSIINDIN